MKYWLMKSEEGCYSISDLEAAEGPAMWEGCRSYQVRNMFRDEFQPGDLALFHHSNGKPTGVVGTMRVTSAAYPDPTQFDPSNEHHDPKSRPEVPIWLAVDVELIEKFPATVTMYALRADPETAEMLVLRRGQRLSVMPVTATEWEAVLRLGRAEVPPPK